MRIREWSADVCSSVLLRDADLVDRAVQAGEVLDPEQGDSLLSAAPGDPVGPSAAQLLRQPAELDRPALARNAVDLAERQDARLDHFADRPRERSEPLAIGTAAL